jgi:5-methylthioadenosine/S-adenosylhomocysteine deaminase
MIIVAQCLLRPGEHHLDNAAVRIVDGKIGAVGHARELKARYPYDDVKDFGKAVIAPGFVDAHTHIEYGLMDGVVNDAPYAQWKDALHNKELLMTKEDWDASALIGALHAIRGGVTSISDVTNTGASVRAAIKTGLHGTIYREVNANRKEEVAPAMEKADDDIHRWRHESRDTGLHIGIGPGALYATHPDVLDAVADYGSDGTPVAIHLAGTREECDYIRYGRTPFFYHTASDVIPVQCDAILPMGVSPVRYALNRGLFNDPNVMAIHCVQVDDSDIEALAEMGVKVVICPRSNAKRGCGISPLIKFLDHGITVGIGTNSPASSGIIDMLAEMRFTLMVERGIAGERYEGADSQYTFLSPKEVLEFATIGGAKALGLESEVGSMKPGSRADLVVYDLSNTALVESQSPNARFVHGATREDVIMTLIDGQPVYSREKGYLLDLDYERLEAHSAEIRAKLRA